MGRPLPTSRFDHACAITWNVLRLLLGQIKLGQWLSRKSTKNSDISRRSAREAAEVYHKLNQLQLTGEASPRVLLNIYILKKPCYNELVDMFLMLFYILIVRPYYWGDFLIVCVCPQRCQFSRSCRQKFCVWRVASWNLHLCRTEDKAICLCSLVFSCRKYFGY